MKASIGLTINNLVNDMVHIYLKSVCTAIDPEEIPPNKLDTLVELQQIRCQISTIILDSFDD